MVSTVQPMARAHACMRMHGARAVLVRGRPPNPAGWLPYCADCHALPLAVLKASAPDFPRELFIEKWYAHFRHGIRALVLPRGRAGRSAPRPSQRTAIDSVRERHDY